MKELFDFRDWTTDWKNAFSEKRFGYSLIFILLCFFTQMSFISLFQTLIEMRPGVQFIDPLTANWGVYSLHWVIFLPLYLSHLLAILWAVHKPSRFIRLLLGYFFVYFFRIFSMWLIPLEAPIGLIPLQDPFLIWFGNGVIINKDLFYSGHTATMFMIFLMTQHKWAKWIIGISLVIVVVGILFQRVHYSVDVYSAFFFAYCAYRAALWVAGKIEKK